MALPQPPRAELTGEKAGDTGNDIPVFPAKSTPSQTASFAPPLPTSPTILVRRISLDDKAKVKEISIENDNTGWLKKKLFKKEITWPRELYLNVLVCKALVPPALKGRPSSNASYGVESENLESETATASVTTEGEGDARVVHPATITPGVMNAGLEGGDAESGGVDGVNGSDHEIVDGEEGYDEGVGKEAADSDVSDEDESEEEGQREEEEETGERGGGCFVRIRNATTGCDLQTQTMNGTADPVFHEAFVVPCQGPRDAVALEVFFGGGETGQQPLLAIGEAALPLDARAVGVSHPVLLSVKDKQGRIRGFLRVEAFWVDEAKPRKETGEFYYKVVHPRGVSLRDEPRISGERSLQHVMKYGEVFVASQRQWHVGDGECTVFVKVLTARDRWARSGWCFEKLVRNGKTEAVLERASPPCREVGRYFYRVCNPKGAKLYSKPKTKSRVRKALLKEGQVLEAREKWTPAGCPVTFVTVESARGFIVQRCGQKVVQNKAGEPTFEEISCPVGTILSSVGVPSPEEENSGQGEENSSQASLTPPASRSPSTSPAKPCRNKLATTTTATTTPSSTIPDGDDYSSSSSSNDGGRRLGYHGDGDGDDLVARNACDGHGHGDVPSNVKDGRSSGGGGDSGIVVSIETSSKVEAIHKKLSRVEAAAAAAAVHRLYRVREGKGVGATKTPDIVATPLDLMEAGTVFFGKAEVIKHYEGIGEVAFVMRETDGLWVRANRPGVSVLLDCFTNRVEPGAFTYRVSHENGVLVRTAPGLDAPPIKPRRILPVKKLLNVCERLTRAEDIVAMSRPPVFLKLAGNDGWVFDQRGHTIVCEDVTVKSRIATANAISSEAARLTLRR